jgi:TatD DNase family protein
MYLDIHAHFAEEGYDIPAELAHIRAQGVEKIVLASDSVLHAQMHAQMSEENGGVYFTAGIHPSEIEGFGTQTLAALRELCQKEKCIAVGEIGLDYHYPDYDKTAQREAFIQQILLADELGLPVQIHSRDGAADTLAIVREMRAHLTHGALLHCYSYGVDVMQEFLQMGFSFSFGGVTCFKNAKKAVECVAHCPMERILSETDSPYLSPFRGEKNSPANIPVIVRRMAEIKGVDEEILKDQIERNATRLFPKLV